MINAVKTTDPLSQPTPPFPPQRQQPPGDEQDVHPEPRWQGERYRPSGKLEDHTALITGGDSGIGRAVAYHFAREGAEVAIACLPEEHEDAKVTQEAIHELGGKCLILTGDLAEPEHCDQLIDDTLQEYGKLNTLVHNAAWQNRKDIENLSDDELETTVSVNINAYLRLARAAVSRMNPGSSIIATGSVVGLSGSPRLSDYGATKGAIHAITKSLAIELHDKGIRVNCVAPGPVWTPLNPADTGVDPDDVAEFGKELGGTQMGRPAQPEELAPAYVFLASNADSSYINGAILPVTGEPT